jgi:hypothetical protein
VRLVVSAPPAVLPDLDPVRSVALRLIGLVVATLAVLTGKCHRDPNISACHISSLLRQCLDKIKTPAKGKGDPEE